MKHKIFPPAGGLVALSGSALGSGGVTVSGCGHNWVVIGLLIGGRVLGEFGCYSVFASGAQNDSLGGLCYFIVCIFG